MSEEEVRAEISYVDDKVTEITGEPTRFFRPPFIDVSESLYDAVDLPFICGIDCQDYMENVTAQERADYIMNGAKDGVIVLLHDAAGNQQTVDALKIVMPQLVEHGYEFVTLTELFERQGETPKDNILYSNVAKYPCADYQKKLEITSETPDRIPLDLTLLSDFGDDYAIELNYTSGTGYPPVIALQRWSSTPSIWHPIQPFYFNGEKAVFLAEDINSALKQLDISYSDSIADFEFSAFASIVIVIIKNTSIATITRVPAYLRLADVNCLKARLGDKNFLLIGTFILLSK